MTGETKIGRPPLPDSQRADSQIQLRVTRKRKRPRRKCAYCGQCGLSSEMVGTPTGVYRSECHMAHKKCLQEK